jgi:hypothetical protein
MNKTQQLKGTTENVAAWLRLQRESAIATGRTVVVHSFAYPGVPGDLHIHTTVPQPGPKFPRNVSYWSASNVTFTPDGRIGAPGMIILRNTRGLRDTIAFQASGLILVR